MEAGQQQEATINPDGSSSYQQDTPPLGESPPVTEPLGSADSSPPTIDPTTAFGSDDAENGGGAGAGGFFDEGGDGMPNFDDLPPVAKPESGIDPAVYLILAFVLIVAIYWFFFMRKKSEDEDDDFFASIDGDKVRELCDEVKPVSKESSHAWVLPLIMPSTVREASKAAFRGGGLL